MLLGEWESDAALLEHTIASKLIALGIHPEDSAALRELARRIFALEDEAQIHRQLYSRQLEERIVAELAGLSQLMLRTMALAADAGHEIHAGSTWKAFARALYDEGEARGKLKTAKPKFHA